jgi:hypothetical protein
MTFQDPLSLIPPLLASELDPSSDLLALISECGNARETILVLSECVERSRNTLRTQAVADEEPASDDDGSEDESPSKRIETEEKVGSGGRTINDQCRLIIEAYSAGSSTSLLPYLSSEE